MLSDLAKDATAVTGLGGLALAAAPCLTYQGIFERVFSAFQHDDTPMEATFALATGEQGQTQFTRYLMITDAGSSLQRMRNGQRETYRWEDWQNYLTVPSATSVDPRLTWTDTGDPFQGTSFVLLEVCSAPHRFNTLEDLQTSGTLFRTIQKLFLPPLTFQLDWTDKNNPTAVKAILRQNLSQLRDWLLDNEPGLSMRDITIVCNLVGEAALEASGLKPPPGEAFTTQGTRNGGEIVAALDTLPGAEIPETMSMTARPAVHHF